MDVRIETILGQNITLLFNSLNLATIDRNELKALRGAETKPTTIDTPDMIVAVYPPDPIFIQIGDRRIRITLPQGGDDAGKVPLWELAVKCHRMIPETDSALIAYGFNYDAMVVLQDGDVNEAMIARFMSNRKMVETAVDGALVSLLPRFTFRRDGTLYDLALEPIEVERIKVHLNVHHQFEGIRLPSQDELQVAYVSGREYLTAVVPRLFQEGS